MGKGILSGNGSTEIIDSNHKQIYYMRDTYKYKFKVGNLVVHGGITNDLRRREYEHQNSGRYSTYNGKRYPWSAGHIVQIGSAVTRDSALQWERDNGFGANQ